MLYHPFFIAGVCGEDRRRGEVHVLARAELRRSEEGGDDMPHAETPAHRGAAGDLLQVNTALDPASCILTSVSKSNYITTHTTDCLLTILSNDFPKKMATT